MTLGPVGQQMQAERECRRFAREAKQRRLHGHDFTALEPCADCDQRHEPGLCTDPSEHELKCVLERERCPRPCIALCVYALRCPTCAASPGRQCQPAAADQPGGVHAERWLAADRIAVEQTPWVLLAAWGTNGLSAISQQLEQAGKANSNNPSALPGSAPRKEQQ